MIVFYSMMIFPLILLMLGAGTRYYDSNGAYKVSNLAGLVTFGYIIFWTGLRSEFIDTANYMHMFNNADTGIRAAIEMLSSDRKGTVFYALQILFKTYISSDSQVWIFFLALITGLLILKTLHKYSQNFYFSVYLFVTSLCVTWMMNGIRQFLAVALIFAAFDYLVEGKLIKYLVIVLLASTIHVTALIMIPVYLIVRSKPGSARVMLSIAVTILIILFIDRFTDALNLVLEETNYAGATLQFAEDDGVNPMRVVVALVPIIVALLGRQIIPHIKDTPRDIMINMSVLTASMYAIGVFTSGILIGRLPIYTEIFTIMSLPALINQCFEQRSRNIMYIMCGLGYFIYFYLQMHGVAYISNVLHLSL